MVVNAATAATDINATHANVAKSFFAFIIVKVFNVVCIIERLRERFLSRGERIVTIMLKNTVKKVGEVAEMS